MKTSPWNGGVALLAVGVSLATAQESLTPHESIRRVTPSAQPQGIATRVDDATGLTRDPGAGLQPAAIRPAREDLKKIGEQWNDVKARWENESIRHAAVTGKIEQMPEGSAKKRAAAVEAGQHRELSRDLAAEREAVHEKIIKEVNRRTTSGRTEASAPLEKTSGTKVTDPGHRGMDGDLDLGGGSRSADKVREVLHDMGIDSKPVTKGGTVEYGDGLNITINKQGKLGSEGSGAYDTQVKVDAANKETYVSESMKKPDGTRQAGTDYVEVQDHKKKALKGLEASPEDLAANPEATRDMVKGTQKTMDAHLSDGEIQDILVKNKIPGTADDFRQKMRAIKEGRSTLDPADAEKIQQASRDIFNQAEQKTGAQADSEFKQTQQEINRLNQAGDREGARRLESELQDSHVKMQATEQANRGLTETEGPLADGIRRPAANGTEGSTRGQVAEGFEGKPRAPTESPEAMPGEPGKFGKAADVLGHAMQAIDIFSNAEDAKQALKNGDTQKLGEVAVNTLDGFTGGALGTSRLINDRLNTARGEKNDAQEEARRLAVVASEQQMRVDMRRNGYSMEQVNQIMAAHALGDDGPLKVSYTAMGKDVPKPVETDPTWTETAKNYGREVFENTGEVTQGMEEKAVKASKFLNDERKDLTEIGSGLTESGTRTELIKQQSENIGDWWNNGSGRKENQQAEQTEAVNKTALTDYLVHRGATPEGAQKAADAMYDKGDVSKFQKLTTMLKDKKPYQYGVPPDRSVPSQAVGANPAANVSANVFGYNKIPGNSVQTEQAKKTQGTVATTAKNVGASDGKGRSAQGVAKGDGVRINNGVTPTHSQPVPSSTVSRANTASTAVKIPAAHATNASEKLIAAELFHCPVCKSLETRLMQISSPTFRQVLRCKHCGYSGPVFKPGPTTPPTITAKPSPPPASTPKGSKCPVCGSFDTVFHPTGNFGPYLKCNHCGAATH